MSIYTWICMYEYIYEYICWVYMFICMSIHVWVFINVYTHKYVCMYKYICISVYGWIIVDSWEYIYEYIWLIYSLWVYIYEYVRMSKYVFMSMYVWVYIWVCTYKYVSIYICMHVMLCYHWVTNHCGCCYYNEKYGGTALMNAAMNGHGDIVTYLVEQGANKDLQDQVSIHPPRMIMIMMIVYILSSW